MTDLHPLQPIQEFRKERLLFGRRSDFLEGNKLPRSLYVRVLVMEERREEREEGPRGYQS